MNNVLQKFLQISENGLQQGHKDQKVQKDKKGHVVHLQGPNPIQVSGVDVAANKYSHTLRMHH